MTMDLFPASPGGGPGRHAPLADRLRPQALEEVAGQEHVTGPGKLLRRIAEGATLPSLILWGPPGSGKTTLARILAGKSRFVGLSAVTAGVKDIRDAVSGTAGGGSRRTVLFLDEIHRFNKAQQDALLPHVESGRIVLIGATTENPSFEINAALLSRTRVVVLRTLDEAALRSVLRRALADPERGLGGAGVDLPDDAVGLLLAAADGDARRLLNVLEVAVDLAGGADPDGVHVGADHVREAIQTATLRYDRAGDEHFNLISALHKSVRASDRQGAVYWLRRMLVAGEDPLYVARRLVRIASEDVGLADPRALEQAVAAQQAVHFLGLPEGGLALLQCALYLAGAPKSNRLAVAEAAADAAIEETGTLPVPEAFRNAPTALMRDLGYGKDYVYDHDVPGGVSGQETLPPELRGRRFYTPGKRGYEAGGSPGGETGEGDESPAE